MFIDISNNVVICSEEILGVFDLDTSTISIKTREYLALAEKRGRVINVSQELPKSFIVMNNQEQDIYISQLSSSTIKKKIKIK